MKVILTKRVPKLGDEWDTVTVKDGYARNFLFPKKLASPATPTLIQKAEKVQADRVKKVEEMVKNAKEMADKLKDTELKFKKKAKDEKLYGSITDKEIIEALAKDHKVEVSKEMIDVKEPIKTVGEHKISLNLAEGVKVEIKINVEAEK